MHSTDAITIFHELIGVSSYQLLPNGVYTIIGVSVQQSGVASVSTIKCGSNVIAKNYGKDFPFNNLNYVCLNELSVSKTGQDDASFIVTYLPYNTQTLATSTLINGVSLKQGFTYGEVLIVFFLIMIFTLIFFSELKKWIFGVRIENPMKNKYNKDL